MRRILFSLLTVLPLLAHATEVPAPAAQPARQVIHRGESGQTPVEAAFRYLKDRIADERGIADYQQLRITQQSQGEDMQHVKLEVELRGLLDDAVKTQRFRFALSFEGEAWVIDSASQDWQCRRGGKGWTQRPCK